MEARVDKGFSRSYHGCRVFLLNVGSAWIYEIELPDVGWETFSEASASERDAWRRARIHYWFHVVGEKIRARHRAAFGAA